METSNDKDGDGSECPTESDVNRSSTSRDSSEPSTSKSRLDASRSTNGERCNQITLRFCFTML